MRVLPDRQVDCLSFPSGSEEPLMSPSPHTHPQRTKRAAAIRAGLGAVLVAVFAVAAPTSVAHAPPTRAARARLPPPPAPPARRPAPPAPSPRPASRPVLPGAGGTRAPTSRAGRPSATRSTGCWSVRLIPQSEEHTSDLHSHS